MIDYSSASIRALAIHEAGNKSREEGMYVNPALADISDESLREVLMKFFLSPFKGAEMFRFTHETGLEFNEVYNYVRSIFLAPESLHLQSINILKHLYEQSDHPRIKSGELYVVHFREIMAGDVKTDAIGIFKTEHKDTYLRFGKGDDHLALFHEEGIDPKKLDKGCLIVNTEGEEGFHVLIPSAEMSEAQYWTQDFLHLVRVNDNHFQTKNYLTMCKDFVDDVYAEDADKKEQVMFLNRSMEYFNSHDEFNEADFKKQVIGDPVYEERFREYRKGYEEESGVEVVEDFPIFKPAVRNMKKKFKNLIRLDTDIEIKLNLSDGERSNHFVERDFDQEKGMYYYKLYFNQES